MSQSRRITVRRRIVPLVVLLLIVAGRSAAQESKPSAKRIEYVGPDTYILLDAEGRPQPVPGMSYEDFLAAWKQLQQQPNAGRERRYSIESIDIAGETRDGHARLQFTAQVQFLTDGAVEVPLGLLGAVLDREPKFDSPEGGPGAGDDTIDPSQEYLYLNPQRGGFVAHFDGQSGERREVTLELLVPLMRDGTETTLPLNCPRALTSHLELSIDQPVGNVIVNQGTLLPPESTAGGGTRLNVTGATGAVRLTWHAAGPAAPEIDTVLSTAGTIRVAIDGRSVRSDARLTVQSYGGGFDRFRVRLPPGAQLVPDERSAADPENPYRIRIDDKPAPATRAGDGAAPQQVVLVQFSETQRTPVVVALSTEQPIGLEDGGPVVELGGFEVLDAVRQYGDVAVEVAGDWQARWQLGDYVRQVDPSELDASLQQSDLTAAFQYDRQPWRLSSRIAPRQFRVHVAPQYELEVLSDEARLTVHLAYQVFGTRAFEFQVALKDWEMAEDPIDSGGLVDLDRIQVTPDGTLVLPLAQSSSRRAEIAFTLRRPLPREKNRLRLSLPVPLADSTGTGELLVAAAADVELLPDLAASTGLRPMLLTESVAPRENGQAAAYGFRTSLPDAVFVAERLHRSREATVETDAQIDLQPAEARIDQRFDYAIRYEPIKELSFQVSGELPPDPEQTQVKLLVPSGPGEENFEDDRPPLSFTYTDVAGEVSAEARQLRVVLPQPRLGRFGLLIRYVVPAPKSDRSKGSLTLPLFQPADGGVLAQTASIRAPRTLSVAIDAAAPGSSWQMLPSRAVDQQAPIYECVADEPEPLLPLLVQAVDPNLPSSTIVERVWLQSWIAGDVRQDRAAFRFRSTASQATIELPPRLPPDEVEVLLDGKPADLLSRDAGRIVVRCAAASDANPASSAVEVAPRTLELRYRQPAQRGLIRRHRLTPPQIVGATALSEVYWQIVLPGDQHLVRSPDSMTSASQWQWLGAFWGRQPVRSQQQLEDWSGASAQRAPASGDSQHLFTGLAPVSTIEVITAPRWLIVLAMSSAVLLALLVWTYIPRSQRGWCVIGAAALIVGLAIAFPAPALLLAQAAALGVAVAALSLLATRLAARPMPWPVTLSAGSSQRQVAPRGDSMLIHPVATAPSTAPTAPLGVSDSQR